MENSKNSWNKHWNNLNSTSVLNNVFVFFRTNVIARDIAYSLNKYFPKDGIFLDSGCGTSQTSVKIPRHNRKFIAMDIADIIFHNHPDIVDYRVNGDVLRLPFKDDSIDGIWNVGLMEHFKPDELNIIFKEFNRILKPGCNAVLFWPPVYGPVNLVIKSLSFFNRKLNKDGESMFPEEPSLVRSKEWVRKIVEKNNLSLVDFHWPLRGAFIHLTVVIKKL